MSRTLTLLRHAPLAPAHHHRYNGWRDLPIDREAIEPSSVRALRQMYFDHCYSSDLQRTQATLRYLGKPYTTDSRLREVQFKPEIEGLSFEEVAALPSFRPHYLDSAEAWHTYICQESPKAFTARIEAFLDRLPTDQDLLICSHAGTLARMMELLGVAVERLDYLEYRTYEL